MLIDLCPHHNKMKAHAERELRLLGFTENTNLDGMAIGLTVMSLIRILCSRDHDRKAIDLITSLFNDLSHMKVLSPLTGEDSEWLPAENGVQKNVRLPNVTRTVDGCFYLAAIVWQDIDTERVWIGALDKTTSSAHRIKFPFAPASVMVRVQEIPGQPGEFEPVDLQSLQDVRTRLDELFLGITPESNENSEPYTNPTPEEIVNPE